MIVQSASRQEVLDIKNKPRQFVEPQRDGTVSWQTYLSFLKSNGSNMWIVIILILSGLIQVLNGLVDVLIGFW